MFETPDNSNTDPDGAPKGEASFSPTEAMDKLPMIGPITWLYARTPDRRFLFLGDIDWAILPPVLLDQCRLFLRNKMPFGFITWAHVSNEVNDRLLLGNNKLAPHEWKGGPHTWLIDVVTPFGERQEMLREVRRQSFPGQTLRYTAINQLTQKPELQIFEQ